MKTNVSRLGVALLLAGGLALAQQPPVAPSPPPPAEAQQPAFAPPPARAAQVQKLLRSQSIAGQPAMGELMAGRPGRWWGNPEMAQQLGLSADQIKRMDDIFQQFRLQLIDLNANLQKQELILEPLVSADQPEEPKILAQIDKVVQARAELEKANARMLLGVRRVLTQEQWQKLKANSLAIPRLAEPAAPGGPVSTPPPMPRKR